ncbi:Immunoglobulin heavy variable 3-23 [Plecturocebus cupreus]
MEAREPGGEREGVPVARAALSLGLAEKLPPLGQVRAALLQGARVGRVGAPSRRALLREAARGLRRRSSGCGRGPRGGAIPTSVAQGGRAGPPQMQFWAQARAVELLGLLPLWSALRTPPLGRLGGGLPAGASTRGRGASAAKPTPAAGSELGAAAAGGVGSSSVSAFAAGLGTSSENSDSVTDRMLIFCQLKIHWHVQLSDGFTSDPSPDTKVYKSTPALIWCFFCSLWNFFLLTFLLRLSLASPAHCKKKDGSLWTKLQGSSPFLGAQVVAPTATLGRLKGLSSVLLLRTLHCIVWRLIWECSWLVKTERDKLVWRRAQVQNYQEFPFSVQVFAGVQCEVHLEEPGGGLVKPRGSQRLCYAASSFTFNSYCMQWVRQASGRGLEWVSVVVGVAQAIRTLKGRFTVSRDKVKKSLYLQNEQPESRGQGHFLVKIPPPTLPFLSVHTMGSGLIWASLLITLSIQVPCGLGSVVASPHEAVLSLFPLSLQKFYVKFSGGEMLQPSGSQIFLQHLWIHVHVKQHKLDPAGFMTGVGVGDNMSDSSGSSPGILLAYKEDNSPSAHSFQKTFPQDDQPESLGPRLLLL